MTITNILLTVVVIIIAGLAIFYYIKKLKTIFQKNIV